MVGSEVRGGRGEVYISCHERCMAAMQFCVIDSNLLLLPRPLHPTISFESHVYAWAVKSEYGQFLPSYLAQLA
jgi:hypothetical protein